MEVLLSLVAFLSGCVGLLKERMPDSRFKPLLTPLVFLVLLTTLILSLLKANEAERKLVLQAAALRSSNEKLDRLQLPAWLTGGTVVMTADLSGTAAGDLRSGIRTLWETSKVSPGYEELSTEPTNLINWMKLGTGGEVQTDSERKKTQSVLVYRKWDKSLEIYPGVWKQSTPALNAGLMGLNSAGLIVFWAEPATVIEVEDEQLGVLTRLGELKLRTPVKGLAGGEKWAYCKLDIVKYVYDLEKERLFLLYRMPPTLIKDYSSQKPALLSDLLGKKVFFKYMSPRVTPMPDNLKVDEIPDYNNLVNANCFSEVSIRLAFSYHQSIVGVFHVESKGVDNKVLSLDTFAMPQTVAGLELHFLDRYGAWIGDQFGNF